MANSENESVWEVLGEARLGATGDMPFAYRVGLPDEPEIIDVSTKKIIKPRAIRIKNVTLTELLDRIEAALKRNGNAAAMREALNVVHRIAATAKSDFDVFAGIERIRRISMSALSAPPRNCDVGTAEEQAVRFGALCGKYYNEEYPCDKECPLASLPMIHGFPRCQAYWAQMPYEGGAM